MTLRPLALTALLALAPACASLDDPATSVVTSSLADCEDIICGNSPLLGGQPFWELDQSMKSYSPVGGFRIKSFKSAGNVELTPRVSGFGLFGISAAKLWYGPLALVGSKLVIESRHGGEYELTLDDVGTLPFVEGGDDGTAIPTYVWRYLKVGAPTPVQLKFVCPNNNIELGTKAAIVFSGDRYSQATGRVSATGGAVGPWFNIACDNDALWKMAEFRHVQAARSLPLYDTDVKDRDAALMAIRADYCGNNHPWTDLGVDVDWANQDGWLWINHFKYKKVEAIWDDDKAFCLVNPRKHTFAEIDCWPNDAAHTCTPEQVTNWVADGHRMITFVP
jgi:hypothetical protein